MPYAEADGGRVYYETYGDGPPLVIAPAFGATTRTYRGLLPKLVDTHRVILFDLRGMGQSDDMPEHTSMTWAADDIACVLDDLGIGRTSLVGPSMGGLIAQHFSVRHRDRLDRLVLVTPPATRSQHRIFIHQMLVDLLKAYPPSRVMEHLMHLALSPEFLNKHPVVVGQMVKGVRVNAREGETLMRLMLGSYTFEGVPGLEQMDAPTLIIAGQLDILAPPAESRDLYARLPNCRLMVLSGVGHSPFIENTKETFGAIEQFLACDRTECGTGPASGDVLAEAGGGMSE